MVFPHGVSPSGGAGFWGAGVIDGEVVVVLGGRGVVLVSAKTILAVKKDRLQIVTKNKTLKKSFIYGPMPN